MYLAARLSPASIRQYLNIIQLLHKSSGFPSPLAGNWALDTVLKGISRVKGTSVQRKLPVDPHLLLSIKSLLTPSKPCDLVFWACSLTMFFCLLRKSHVLPISLAAFDPSKQLCRSDVKIHPFGLQYGLILLIRWSKTIQTRQRVLQLPLPYLADNPLCPTTAVIAAFALVPSAPLNAPAFLIPGPDQKYSPLFYSSFLKQFRSLLSQLHIEPDAYAGHSFRRGGATWALLQGLSPDVIRLLGDWQSTAYTAYLDLSLPARMQAISQFSKHLPKLPPSK